MGPSASLNVIFSSGCTDFRRCQGEDISNVWRFALEPIDAVCQCDEAESAKGAAEVRRWRSGGVAMTG